MKDSFVFRKEWKDALSGLPTDVRVEVYEAIIEYGTSGTEPENLKPLARLAFNFAKTTLDKDSERYEDIKRKRSEAGAKGAAVTNRQKAANVGKNRQSTANSADNVYVYVNDNQLSNESVVNNAPAHTHEGYDVNEEYLDKFFKTNIGQMEKLLMDLGMKPEDKKKVRDIAEAIVNEWRITEQFHTSYNDWCRHLVSTLRIKAKIDNDKPATFSKVDAAKEGREEYERLKEEERKKRDEMFKQSVSYQDAKNSEEYRRAMAEA